MKNKNNFQNSTLDNISLPTDLELAARQVLENNDQGTYTMPAHGLYPHQWLWDSCFISIGQRHYDTKRAKNEILSLLSSQWSNGMIPHLILHPHNNDNGHEKQYNKQEKIWRSWLNPYAPNDINTSGITQPPMIAEACYLIGQKLYKTDRRSWYKQIYPSLLHYHQWLYSERDPHNEGLVLQVHPWETGLDNTPPWMQELHDHLMPSWIRILHKSHLDNLVGLFRTDRRFITNKERIATVDALALFDVQRRMRRKNYDFDRYIDHALFVIEDLTFNSIFIRANYHLKNIAKIIGQEIPPELNQKMQQTEESLNNLWDADSSQFYSRDFVTHRLLTVPSIATLLPLYAGSISVEKAKKLVSLIEDPNIFGANYPLPSTPLNSKWFSEYCYWQGPSWININWLIIDGLKRYGYNDHAAALRESTIELIANNGFYEYFNPNTGQGAGTNNFSWTAALAIDFMHQKD